MKMVQRHGPRALARVEQEAGELAADGDERAPTWRRLVDVVRAVSEVVPAPEARLH